MRIATIKYNDIANGEGVRVSLFVSGCTHHCKDCFNEVAWDFHYGEEYTQEIEEKILKGLAPSYVEGITLLGGEPLEPINQEGLLPLLRRIKKEMPEKNIWLYTGYTLEKDIFSPSKIQTPYLQELLSYVDILIDGEFVKELYDISLQFRGSKNQRVLDLRKTLIEHQPVIWNKLSK